MGRRRCKIRKVAKTKTDEEILMYETKRNFLHTALISFTNCTSEEMLDITNYDDRRKSRVIIQLLNGARNIAISIVPCTSKITNKYANAKVTASTVTSAYKLKCFKTHMAIPKDFDEYMDTFEVIFKEFWKERNTLI